MRLMQMRRRSGCAGRPAKPDLQDKDRIKGTDQTEANVMAKAKKQKPADNALPQYEAMFLLGAAATAEPEKGVETCRGIIERHGGQIMVIKKWDERKLAYEISGPKRGTYVISFFTAPGAAVAAIERDVKLSEE